MFVVVVAVGLLVGWILQRGQSAVAEVGAPAPDFTVALIDGGTFSLSEHLELDGRPLVLNLWASWCVPCRVEIPEISAFSMANPGVRVLGVAVFDAEEAATAFAAEIRASYPLALGDDAFEAAYPRLGLPVTYLIDSEGVVEAVHNGILDRETLESLTAG